RGGGCGAYGLKGDIRKKLTGFAPRLGIAYQLKPKTVIRAGYGRSYDIGVFGSNFGHTVTQNLPVLLKQNYDATTYSQTGASANFNPIYFQNPVPNGQNGAPFLLDTGPTGFRIHPSSPFHPPSPLPS